MTRMASARALSVGGSHGDGAAWSEFDGDVCGVDGGVVSGAYRYKVVEVGGSAVFPPVDVMDFAVVEPDGTVRDGTGAVHGA